MRKLQSRGSSNRSYYDQELLTWGYVRPRQRWVFGVIRLVQRAVSVEGLARALEEKDLSVAKKPVYSVALVDGDEEEFAFTGSPTYEEILRREEDWWGIGEGR